MKKEKILNASWDLVKLVLSALIGFSFAYITFSKQYDATERGRLNSNLNKILELDMERPFFENSSFVAQWNQNKNSNSDSSLRYQSYCMYVFNFLQDVCEYYNYDKEKISGFIDIHDLIKLHKGWWNLPENKNPASYPTKFINFINAYY